MFRASVFAFFVKLVSGLLLAQIGLVYGQNGSATGQGGGRVEVVKKFFGDRPGNLAVDSKGNIYVTMHPMDNPRTKLVKIGSNGAVNAFPNQQMASKPKAGEAGIGISNTIGIFITQDDTLFVLDMGDEGFQPKLVLWDLAKNELKRTYFIPGEMLVQGSFLQDLAVDEKRGFVYIADMGRGGTPGENKSAIIALDLKTGVMKRLLESDASMVVASNMKAEGKELIAGGKPLKPGINPISIDPQNEWLYYGVMPEGFIYRIKSADLSNFSLSNTQLSKKLEKFNNKPFSDGFKVDSTGEVYVGDVENSAIVVIGKGTYTEYIKDPMLGWVDGLFIANDGYVYATLNQLNRHPELNGGVEAGKKPYLVVRFKKMLLVN